jgi:signal transduction histidine kinase
VEINRLINQTLPIPLSARSRAVLLRAIWLAVTSTVIILLVMAVPWRFRMLRADVYGFGQGLEAMGLSLDFFATYFVAMELLVIVGSLMVATLIAWKRSDDWFAILVAISLTLFGLLPPLVDGLIYLSPQWTLPIVTLRFIEFGCMMAVFCLFPNGRFAPPWTRWLLLLYMIIWSVLLLINPRILADTAVLPNTRTLDDASWVLFGTGWFLLAIIGQIVRYRRYASPAEKQQMKWVLIGFSLSIIFSLASSILLISVPGLTNSPDNEAGMIVVMGGLYLLTALVLPVSIALSILRYRLWDVDNLLNRTLVYGGLTLSITAVYVLLVGGLGALAVTRSGTILALILATALVLALVRSPLRARWQTAIDRFVPSANPHSQIPHPTPQIANHHSGEGLYGAKRWLVWLSLAMAIVLTAANMGAAAVYANQSPDLVYLTGPSFVAVGSFIIMRQPQNRIGRLCLLAGWVSVLIFLGFNKDLVLHLAQSDVQRAAITQINLSLGQVMCILIFVYLLLLFPDGRFPGPGWRRFWRFFAVSMALLIVLILTKPGPIWNWATGEGALALANPFGVEWPLHDRVSTETLVYAWGVPTMLATFAAIGSLISRWRRSDGLTRQQVKWVAYFLGTVMTLFMLLELSLWLFHPYLTQSAFYPAYETIYGMLGVIAWVGLPLVIGLAVFKYRLYDIDFIINRTLVYGGLSLAVIGVYVVVVGAMGTLFQAQGNFLFALLATGLIAVLFQPVRGRLQKGVNRLMFGERDDPYKVLSQLGRQLQTTSTPEATLHSLVETIAITLKLPYVAIELAGEKGRLNGAVTGTAVAQTVDLPLHYQNETVGYLVASPRSPGESFTEREQQLLTDIARQAGAVAYSVRLTAALQQSREKMVLAREEERRRIRRDLHDELGPTLASQTFTLDTALELLETNPDAAARLLQTLKSQNQETVADIRRLVYELRPPALDELGVIGALEVQANRLAMGGSLHIQIISEPHPLPILPAAVEVAAYRIALEAMTNVARHARAGHCNISFRLEENGRQNLHIAVTDDGIGLLSQVETGVGLHSMRERAEELGGSFETYSGKNDGTRVTAVLPL